MSLGAAKLIRDRVAELPQEGPVPSPCICVCTMDQRTGLCIGCYRTLDEIAAWSGMDDARKRDVWRLLAERVGPE
ncbi:DUF1289 domain-containing protein [Ramlibacter sp. USB13]|uniref:DUF1289 domain-containing protein n=1 Tax=Ramlibacter cellulosilyticus TaxID=2764187 RepID=A0A923SDN7_9BURK|nr:DUF1289 domain-containing protein [Ramlibacter cellulosilyticus]MBC5786114.1 DUF1289 domain-containing protein [Ramlibacter cellulosilyticus]